MNEIDYRAAFIRASAWHGTLDEANAILAAHPDIASADLFTAAILGDSRLVQRCIMADPSSATAKDSTLGWDALTHLCFSRYLRLDAPRSLGFVRAAEALLAAGADARTGIFDESHRPEPDFESVLYAAAGVAHHAGLTQLLVDHGADVNDGEVAYHSPETDDNAALTVLVETGRITAGNLACMLLRKADWHDAEGVRYLLQRGADPNLITGWGVTALHQAILRDNQLATVLAMLDAGAAPLLESPANDGNSVQLAARRGRGDVLDLLEQRNVALELSGADALLAACARNAGEQIGTLTRNEPGVADELLRQSGAALARFVGNGNRVGAARLLALGALVDARFVEGDGYFDIAPESTALHVAAWRAQHDTVIMLLEHGADVRALDGKGRSSLMLAVKACVDSYWMENRSPDSVKALLDAGASVEGITVPCGYEEVDTLLRAV